MDAKEEGRTRMNRRLPASQRAGTRMSPRAEKVYGRGLRGRTVHGLYDPESRVYQCGGELNHFLYRRGGLISLAHGVWDEVKGKARRLEFIDHQQNQCYAVSVETATRTGKTYNAGIGPRYGIPLREFEVT